jgi:hypothetical protein
MLRVESRVVVAVLLDTSYITAPVPVPLAPLVTASHPGDALSTVQAQPVAAVTSIRPPPPPGMKVIEFESSVTAQLVLDGAA